MWGARFREQQGQNLPVLVALLHIILAGDHETAIGVQPHEGSDAHGGALGSCGSRVLSERAGGDGERIIADRSSRGQHRSRRQLPSALQLGDSPLGFGQALDAVDDEGGCWRRGGVCSIGDGRHQLVLVRVRLGLGRGLDRIFAEQLEEQGAVAAACRNTDALGDARVAISQAARGTAQGQRPSSIVSYLLVEECDGR